MSKPFLTILFSSALIAQALAGGVERPEGWWVVLGSFANPDLSAAHDKEIRSLRSRAARCGVDPFNDFSNKFRGFAPRFDVVAVGAYKTRKSAQSVLHRVRACVPEAYIKFGRHLGE
ncbi:hypothetical protein [Methylocystis sp. ATCC 49242]|uniref:hypothetical protein n=1 Tax=Methylocystis sp. ATCC 49242 TaxID=622637 RepID=UPI0001F86A54|nr:hypothetical protein [Methylocystis sp. ATCC 49242]